MIPGVENVRAGDVKGQYHDELALIRNPWAELSLPERQFLMVMLIF